MEPTELPPRARSAFAKQTSAEAPADPDSSKASTPKIGKDGRKLGGFTSPEFQAQHWTDERREQQRQRAQEMIAEGRFGAANGFHRRKTKKFQEIAAEHAQQRADDIVNELDEIIFGKPQNGKRAAPEVRLRAIEQYGKFEDWAVKNSRDDEKEFRKMTNSQLDAAVLRLLEETLGVDLGQVVEGEVVSEEEIDDEILALALIEAGSVSDEEYVGDDA